MRSQWGQVYPLKSPQISLMHVHISKNAKAMASKVQCQIYKKNLIYTYIYIY